MYRRAPWQQKNNIQPQELVVPRWRHLFELILSSPAQACLFAFAGIQREEKTFSQRAEQSCHRYLPLSSVQQRHKQFFIENRLPPWQGLSSWCEENPSILPVLALQDGGRFHGDLITPDSLSETPQPQQECSGSIYLHSHTYRRSLGTLCQQHWNNLRWFYPSHGFHHGHAKGAKAPELVARSLNSRKLYFSDHNWHAACQMLPLLGIWAPLPESCLVCADAHRGQVKLLRGSERGCPMKHWSPG